RGTFNSHPYVMTAMDEFLSRLASPNFRSVYNGLEETWNGRTRQLNEMMEKAELPVRFANLSSIWTVSYETPSRYNWMLQYYLRAEGIALSWVGTGRLIFSLNYTDADFTEVARRFVAAATKMKQDGWGGHTPLLTNKAIRPQILKEMISSRFRPRTRPNAHCPGWTQPGRSVPLFDASHHPGMTMAGTSPAMKPVKAERIQRSGVLLFETAVLENVETRVDQLAAQKRQRRLVIKFEVVEGVGDDLGHPDQAGLDVANEKELHGAKQKP